MAVNSVHFALSANVILALPSALTAAPSTTVSTGSLMRAKETSAPPDVCSTRTALRVRKYPLWRMERLPGLSILNER